MTLMNFKFLLIFAKYLVMASLSITKNNSFYFWKGYFFIIKKCAISMRKKYMYTSNYVRAL